LSPYEGGDIWFYTLVYGDTNNIKKEEREIMKKKIHKIFGVSLTLVMVLSLMMFFAPVAIAADYEENDWGEWGLPDTEPDTDIGPIAVAPDGTLYAGVFYEDASDYFWKVCMSEDDGYTWDDTDLDDLPSDGTARDNLIVSIVVSPNYAEDETVYVGIFDGPDGPVVWRLEDAGDDATSLKPIGNPSSPKVVAKAMLSSVSKRSPPQVTSASMMT